MFNEFELLRRNVSDQNPLKVAAYCRVSTESAEQDISFKAQIEYYTNLIQSNPNWEFAGIFADKKSGMNIKDRAEFRKMMRKCYFGQINLIFTKSVSRFGRNVLDTLSCLQKLADKNITVYFEEQGIHSLSHDALMAIGMLSIHAQQEVSGQRPKCVLGHSTKL